MLLFLSGVSSKFGGLADLRLLLQLTHEVPRYQTDERIVWLYPSLARRQKWTWFFQDLQSLHLFLHRLMHPYFSWVFIFFNDLFSNFLSPGNATRVYCWHRGRIILVKIHEIIWVNVTSKFLHQISEFFIFILV